MRILISANEFIFSNREIKLSRIKVGLKYFELTALIKYCFPTLFLWAALRTSGFRALEDSWPDWPLQIMEQSSRLMMTDFCGTTSTPMDHATVWKNGTEYWRGWHNTLTPTSTHSSRLSCTSIMENKFSGSRDEQEEH